MHLPSLLNHLPYHMVSPEAYVNFNGKQELSERVLQAVLWRNHIHRPVSLAHLPGDAGWLAGLGLELML